MKKITNKKLQTVLLRGAVAMAGVTITLTVMLFTNSWYGAIGVAFVGAVVITLFDEHIKSL